MSRQRLFGTDGMRGTVNQWPMTVDAALRLGLAAGIRFRSGNHKHRVVIGKDTRLSGYMFESALTAGLCAAGMHVIMTGPLPTPAISFLTRNMRADLGVVISASHNPYYDNGIKFFDADGFKLPDTTEDEIAAMTEDYSFKWPYPPSDQIGRATKIEDAGGRYIVYTKSCFPPQLMLSGLRIVIDCANGASYKAAPLALEELGAEVFRIGCEPNGLNINDHCGSLYPEVVSARVRELRADVGLALDGDADRLIVVDEHGAILDGDQLMALCAQAMMARGELPDNLLVAGVHCVIGIGGRAPTLIRLLVLALGEKLHKSVLDKVFLHIVQRNTHESGSFDEALRYLLPLRVKSLYLLPQALDLGLDPLLF